MGLPAEQMSPSRIGAWRAIVVLPSSWVQLGTWQPESQVILPWGVPWVPCCTCLLSHRKNDGILQKSFKWEGKTALQNLNAEAGGCCLLRFLEQIFYISANRCQVHFVTCRDCVTILSGLETG